MFAFFRRDVTTPDEFLVRYVADVDLNCVESSLMPVESLSLASSAHIVVLKFSSSGCLAGLEVHNPIPCKGFPNMKFKGVPVATGSLYCECSRFDDDFPEVEIRANYHLDFGSCSLEIGRLTPKYAVVLSESVTAFLTVENHLAGFELKGVARVDQLY